MNQKHVLSLLFLLFCIQEAQSQQLKPTDPQQRQRLMKYVTDNHLSPGGMYMYWDSVTKKPVRFDAATFLVEDALTPPPAAAAQAAKGAAGSSQLAGSPNFHLVKDVNAVSDAFPSSYQYNSYSPATHYAVLNNVAYFAADDGVHGTELWRSDGTAAGTYLFKDIATGNASAYPYNLYASPTMLYFSVYNSNVNTYQVLASDGIGSNLVSLFPAGTTLSSPSGNFCNANGTVYFTTGNGYYNTKLWKTDGSSAGTSLVGDYSSFYLQGGLFPSLTAVGNIVYMALNTYSNTGGYQALLYRSNGTAGGTYLVKTITSNSGSYFSGITQLTAYNNNLYFVSDDGSGFVTLWVSNGTETGTMPVTNYNSVSLYGYYYYYYQYPLTISNNVLYFPGYTPDTGWELYKYDAASTDGVTLVKDIMPGNNGYLISNYNMADVNGTLYFVYVDIYSGNINHLYKSNGTAAGTVSIKDDAAGNSMYYLYNVNNKLYFVESQQGTNAEPWTSDGTTAGTVRVADLYPGNVGSMPAYFTAVNGKTLFAGSDNVHGNELFTINGSSVQLVKDINTTTTSSSSPYNIVAYGDGVLASAYTFDKGYELYKASATDENLLQDVLPGQPGSYPDYLMAKNNLIYFSAYNSQYSARDIYKTDGTAAGTVKMTSNSSGYIYALTATDNGTVFYVFYSYLTYKYELWKIDGTIGSTLILGTFSYFDYYLSDNINYRPLTAVGNTVYFSANTDGYNTELYKSDGTVAGTVMVKDINPGAYTSSPDYLTVFNNQLYFSAYDGSEYGLWKSDGTSGGTIKLASVTPTYLTVSGNSLFFNGTNSIAGAELWKTDGTLEGTVLVKDIVSGSVSSRPANLINVDGTLFFTAYDESYNYQLWKSNGTSAGTQLVAPLTGGYTGGAGTFASAAGKLFFTLSGKLWASDGTDYGTKAIDDNIASGLSVYRIIANGSKLFLEGYTYQYGAELYEGDASLVVLPVALTGFTASLQNKDVIAQWQTSSEVNTSYFNIQRSTDGVHFITVGRTTAKGSGSTYSYPDVNVANLVSVKTIYYRLQVVDKDGSTSFSKTVPVDLMLKDAIVLLLPNPVKDVLKIRINNYEGKASIGVFDANGKNVYSAQKAVQSGNDVTINASSLQSGVYIVKVSLNGKMVQQKFVKE